MTAERKNHWWRLMLGSGVAFMSLGACMWFAPENAGLRWIAGVAWGYAWAWSVYSKAGPYR
jgi:hypothetical protein